MVYLNWHSCRVCCRQDNARGGFGIVVNLVVGIIGGVLGGWLFGLIGITAGGIIGSLITAVVGAVVLLLDRGAVEQVDE